MGELGDIVEAPEAGASFLDGNLIERVFAYPNSDPELLVYSSRLKLSVGGLRSIKGSFGKLF